MRHIPNIICLLRIVLVWPVLGALQDGSTGSTLAFFVVAAVSDGIDGYLAKRFHWQSELGKFLDPFADKLLLVSVFIAAAWFGLVPWWLTAAAVARDVMIGLGALIFRLWFGPLRGRPTIVSKINTFLQLGYLARRDHACRDRLCHGGSLDVLAVLMFISTVLSGADYLFAFTRRAWNFAGPAPTLPRRTGRRDAGMRQLPLGIRLADRAVFASFLPARNREAVEHVQRLARGERPVRRGCAGRQGPARRICCRRYACRRATRSARDTFR